MFNNPELKLIRNYIPPKRVEVPTDVVQTNDDVSFLINVFVPNHETGYPCSDLQMVVNHVAPEVAEFIRQKLLQPVSSSRGVDSPDLAIEVMRGRGESLENYSARLVSIYERESGKNV